MTALASIDSAADAYKTAIAQIRDANVAVAQQAVGAALILGERLAIMAQETEDPDVVRKAYDSFTRKAEVPEKIAQAQATQAMATAVFNIILDRSVKQVAPPRARPTLVEEVPPPLIQAMLPPDDETGGWALED